MMTRIEDKGEVFVHASDIQLLDSRAVLQILDSHPDIVFASGPPLYLQRLSTAKKEVAWRNAVSLSREVRTLILDHHITRSNEGLAWLKRLSSETGNSVVCAADFMKKPRLLLEAWRKELYRDMPVPNNWHWEYARGKADIEPYQEWRGHKA
jgi:predicted metallo-beta-lactamase superfamily hydrolase